MKEPSRWLDSTRALSPFERRVLTAGRAARVPAGAKAAVKHALTMQLASPPSAIERAAAAGLPGTAPAPAATMLPAVARSILLKFTAAGFAMGVAASALVSAALPVRDVEEPLRLAAPPRRHAPPSPDTSSSPDAARAAMPTPTEAPSPPKVPGALAVATHSAKPTPSIASSAASIGAATPLASVTPAANPPLSAVIDESRRLARARDLLRSNSAREALDVLESMKRDHPSGALVQERQILVIEGLTAVGASHAAADAARDFLERYPTSPHAAAAQRALPH